MLRLATGWGSGTNRYILPNMSTLNQLTLFSESLLYFAYQYVSEVRIDDTVCITDVNNIPEEFSNMKLYSPENLFAPIDGLVKNLKIEMFDDDPTANVPLGK